jgi:inner membrane protein involved in colicin E2 resistance
VVGILASARRVRLHPMHFFFVGCAFFAFHLSFAYLIDHLEIHPSFAIAAGTALLLVVTYARLFVGWTFALREMGLSMLLYLVLFSYTFLWEGLTGLSITIGAIVTLFVMMQITGRLDWSRSLEPRAATPPPEVPTPEVA